jgi:large subunit ribosomal protein L35
MPKMKSNSGAKKRFRITGKGKVKFKKAYHSHILTSKTTKMKRKQRRPAILANSDMKHIRRMLPYAGSG